MTKQQKRKQAKKLKRSKNIQKQLNKISNNLSGSKLHALQAFDDRRLAKAKAKNG